MEAFTYMEIAREYGISTPEQLREALAKAKPTLDIPNPDVPRQEFEALTSYTKLMWAKLKLNANKGGWTQLDPELLLRRLKDEVKELEDVFAEIKIATADKLYISPQTSRFVRSLHVKAGRECADISNFSMFIADVFGQLDYRKR